MVDLAQTIESAEQAEQRMARRRLLASPFVGQQADPEGYSSILRHRRALSDWFAEQTGWHLVVDESGGFARLHKTPSHKDSTRPATCGVDRRPFDRRRYSLLCLTLAVLDEGRSQTTLRQVAEAVTRASHSRGGVAEFDATVYSERRALVDVLKLLVHLEVLRERDGDADRYAAGGNGDVLYDVEDRRIAHLIAAPSSPSLTTGPDGLPVEVYPDTEEGFRTRARHYVMRRLLDDPIVYYEDLDDAQREWLAHSLGFAHRVLEEDLGFQVERRAEGLAAVDPARELSDEVFPDGSSSVKHAALLLAEVLTELVRTQPTPSEATAETAARVVPDLEVRDWVRLYAQEVGARCGWRADYLQGEEGAAVLAEAALALLARFGLVRRVEGGWQPRPAISRFATEVASPTSGRMRRETSPAQLASPDLGTPYQTPGGENDKARS
jgi:uncharacterized protein (TIGR02678 family)